VFHFSSLNLTTVSEMTYNVLSGTLNLTHSLLTWLEKWKHLNKHVYLHIIIYFYASTCIALTKAVATRKLRKLGYNTSLAFWI